MAAGPRTLFRAAESFPVAGKRKIKLPARQPDRAARTATVEMRFGEVEICRPRDERDRNLAKTVRLRLVEVREVDTPEGVEPPHWRLLTTHDVTDAEKAWQIVGWYQARWVIEQLFRVTKSQGLQLEDSQLASADRLVKLTATAIKAACIDMQLVQERDGKHQSPASTVFAKLEIETLEALVPTLEGKTERQQNPHPPRSLARASWVIARPPPPQRHARRVELLLQTPRTDYLQTGYGEIPCHPPRAATRIKTGMRCATPLRRRGQA